MDCSRALAHPGQLLSRTPISQLHIKRRVDIIMGMCRVLQLIAKTPTASTHIVDTYEQCRSRRRATLPGYRHAVWRTESFCHLADDHPPTMPGLSDLSTTYPSRPTPSSFGGPAASNQPRWDFWGRFMQPLIGVKPMTYVAGNHEIESVSSRLRPASHEDKASLCDGFYFKHKRHGGLWQLQGGLMESSVSTSVMREWALSLCSATAYFTDEHLWPIYPPLHGGA